MQQRVHTRPVGEDVAKIDREVAVGEDLEFQRKWWKFERVVWVIFALIFACDLAGVFGRGPLSHAEIRAPDGTMVIRYERVERTGTPSIMDIRFGPGANRNGKISLFVSDSIVKPLGTQRIIPEPETTTIGRGGLTYVFPALPGRTAVEFALQPAAPGIYKFNANIPGGSVVTARVVVVP